ncbi:hypothetical protein ACS5PK_14810 [Roseateles sp. DB2]|uniref:hypothetical protein n=1 Tax=Roseateles sp. DB2 TaxID=3453717 RepID=UPI003EEBFFF1
MRRLFSTAALATTAAFLQPVQAHAATALVLQDQAALRAAARDAAPSQAALWRGEAVEIRGERLDFYQVYDYRRERGGFVRKGQVLPLEGPAAEPAALLAALRLVRLQPGAESLGLGLAAAYVQQASAEQMAGPGGIEALDALGSLAERLAERASRSSAAKLDTPTTSADTQLAAQLDVAARYGLKFQSFEREAGSLQLCYEGEVFRRVLALPASTPEQQARAALALTRPECQNPAATPSQKLQRELWRADILERVPTTGLAPLWRNRLALRQASVWSSLAYAQARQADASAASQSQAASARALQALARLQPGELADDDQPLANDAAMRANAVRWQTLPAGAASMSWRRGNEELQLRLVPGTEGDQCLVLQSTRAKEALLRHCSFGLIQTASFSVNREGNAATLAVQPTEAWRELWLLRQTPQGWRMDVLPPAAANPGLGYAEFAGWVPGGQQLLMVREARAEGRYTPRSFELLDLQTLQVLRRSGDAQQLGPFQRWADAGWKTASLSLR